MKAYHLGRQLQALREQPHWKLLASGNAPWTVALLKTLFDEREKRLSTSVLVERLTHELRDIELSGEFSMGNSAQKYLSIWVDYGYLSRRLPVAGSEEEYELTLDALQAIRHVEALQRPRFSATETRLSTVYERTRSLAERTDPDPRRRVEALNEQIARLQNEIDGIERGQNVSLPEPAALEAVRDLIALVVDIPQDFHRVRDSFERLNSELRQNLVEHEGSRAEVLQAIFDGKDLIADTDAGRTFSTFWAFLKDPILQASMSASLDALLERPFAARLTPEERRYLDDFFGRLLKESAEVQLIHQNLSYSLRSFVRTNGYIENHQLNRWLRRATQAASALKDRIRLNRLVDFSLTLTTATLKSPAQLTLHDPSTHPASSLIEESSVETLDWETLLSMAQSSEIDFTALRRSIREALAGAGQISVARLIETFGASQGLASVVGLLVLAQRHGVVSEGEPPPTELVSWQTTGSPSWRISARIPLCFFLKGAERALAD